MFQSGIQTTSESQNSRMESQRQCGTLQYAKENLCFYQSRRRHFRCGCLGIQNHRFHHVEEFPLLTFHNNIRFLGGLLWCLKNNLHIHRTSLFEIHLVHVISSLFVAMDIDSEGLLWGMHHWSWRGCKHGEMGISYSLPNVKWKWFKIIH